MNCVVDGQPPARNNRRRGAKQVDPEDIDNFDELDKMKFMKCTGKSCKSCSAGVIADCVAVCCCPCAVVNLLILALFKVPWTLGKRILKIGKSKKMKMIKCDTDTEQQNDKISKRNSMVEELEGIPDLVISGNVDDIRGDELINNGNEEEDWFDELNEFGHLSFGRVSFTGISS